MFTRKILLSLCLLFATAMAGTTVRAQDAVESDAPLTNSERKELERLRKEKRSAGVWRPRVFKLGYIDQTLTSPTDEAKSEWGVGYSSYKTGYLHKTPIAGMVKIGLDLGADADFVKFESDRTFDFGFKEEIINKLLKTDRVNDMYQVDAHLGIGPSVKVAPFGYTDNFLNKLNASVYWHFNAGISLLKFSTEEGYFKDGIMPALSLGNTIGVRLSLNRFTVGYEHRVASGKYWCKYDMEVFANGEYISNLSHSGEEKIKFETSTNSLFIGFNF